MEKKGKKKKRTSLKRNPHQHNLFRAAPSIRFDRFRPPGVPAWFNNAKRSRARTNRMNSWTKLMSNVEKKNRNRISTEAHFRGFSFPLFVQLDLPVWCHVTPVSADRVWK